MILLLSPTPSSTLHQVGRSIFTNQCLLHDEDVCSTIPTCSKAISVAGFNGQRIKQSSLQCRITKNDFNSVFAKVKRNCTNEELKEAMKILSFMDQQEIPVNSEIYASLLEACAKHKALALGKQVHKHMLSNKIKQTPILWSELVNMYAQCRSIENARLVFDAMGMNRTVFAWNSMIAGYAREGMYRDALALYCRMKGDGFTPDKFTFPRVLKVCGRIGDLKEGKKVYDDVMKRGLESDVFIVNALMDMYAKCGCIDIAREIFDKMVHKDLVSWNTIISGTWLMADVVV